jgi:hypothetical protein
MRAHSTVVWAVVVNAIVRDDNVSVPDLIQPCTVPRVAVEANMRLLVTLVCAAHPPT